MTSLDKNIRGVVAGLIRSLSVRNRDIIARRFGLGNGRTETLESIGQSYKITRERVRQIEEHVLKNLRAELAKNVSTAVRPYFDLTASWLNEKGGFISEAGLFAEFSNKKERTTANASLVFLLTLNPEFIRYGETDAWKSFWAFNNGADKQLQELLQNVVQALNKKTTLFSQTELWQLLRDQAADGRTLSDKAIASVVNISREIDCNIFGQYGLVNWAEVKPRGVRDRAYLVLKKQNQPKHFREISSLINTAGFAAKKANVQTVHNELIKDKRFVLVGRGMYGLTEWGYKAGTVKDVLMDILRESRRPLSRPELIAKVLSSRFVKENTVVLNLQDHKIFVKKDNGTYALREV